MITASAELATTSVVGDEMQLIRDVSLSRYVLL